MGVNRKTAISRKIRFCFSVSLDFIEISFIKRKIIFLNSDLRSIFY
ncbi:hypothetical protein LEP1GSC151_2409 [Leptospira interrogans serovar Grippotyphosa str. LT2186]|uniref:Uncharacterized protein n=1 Tax=Leptospira interrogans serovar Grippotyphosa str. LT2186 TaxID=1001599 RepID=M3I8G7_LEPIR|nr:hypothetical protein LEP1GSC009_2593 [Leptospira interrogans serovar Grippotyphosa str. Andaman]EKP85684.1 hypothetical protein LEP1GSC020_1305 [Leptospira interrogans serovar Grippotyphosa str. 2006006986]EKR44144.1 hypothetical protein LEP1GSC097_2261 [Leptospira interrogans serovar Grippotyphosa str. UI 08368]EMG11676.1 hypothetical protein LEP1GSC151_2409 [Leptospira interrogans serovar Grippotyphosa str. LT2186]EMN52004.1 hypothetical protein LEP1GSC089_0573 [Leptospira interrogans sero